LNLLGSRLNGPGSTPCVSARCGRDAACRALTAPGLQWLTGTGYIDVLSRVHRAEEQFIEAQEKCQLIGDACGDLLGLRGSNIANRDELIRDLRIAATALEPKAASFFAELTAAAPETGGALDSEKQPTNESARAILKTVRRTLNDYRDAQRIGLLQLRNRILHTIMATKVAALLVLALAIVAGAGTDPILA
jgi:hypothetical protein